MIKIKCHTFALTPFFRDTQHAVKAIVQNITSTEMINMQSADWQALNPMQWIPD